MMSAKYMALALAVLLPGCTMAPNYVRPEAPVAEAWPDDLMPKGTVLAQATDQLASEIGWKTFFTDQHLQRLIQLALDNNRDLRVSALNIERARGLYQIQRADLMPGVSASGESSNKGVSADLSTTGEQTVSRQHSLGVGVTSYELDFFGRIQSLKDKALETYLGTEEAYRSARLSLVSEVAQAYLALVADRERLNIATETLKSQQASYEMIARRHSVGVSSELDLRQAQTSVDTARVDIARYSGQVAKDITALSLLAGTKVTPDMLPAKALSELPVWPDIPVSLPSTVLLQRPDILQAEHTLKAANADIGAARANFFPRISLTANIGTASNELSHLFDGGTGIWTFLPQVSLPIFEGGRNVANLRVSEALFGQHSQAHFIPEPPRTKNARTKAEDPAGQAGRQSENRPKTDRLSGAVCSLLLSAGHLPEEPSAAKQEAAALSPAGGSAEAGCYHRRNKATHRASD